MDLRTPKNEPVLSAGVVTGIVSALIVLLTTFGVDITQEQQAAIMGVLVLIVPIAIAFWPRSKVTPVNSPRVETADGEKIKLVRQDTGNPVRGDI